MLQKYVSLAQAPSIFQSPWIPCCLIYLILIYWEIDCWKRPNFSIAWTHTVKFKISWHVLQNVICRWAVWIYPRYWYSQNQKRIQYLRISTCVMDFQPSGVYINSDLKLCFAVVLLEESSEREGGVNILNMITFPFTRFTNWDHTR